MEGIVLEGSWMGREGKVFEWILASEIRGGDIW